MSDAGPYFVVQSTRGGTLVERSSTEPMVLIPRAEGSLSDMKQIARKLNKESQA